MPRSLTRRFALVVLLATAGYACAEQATPFESISAPAVRVGSPFLSISPIRRTVRVLERSVPLAQDMVVAKVIGAAGGAIELPGAGLELTIPAGAVAVPTEISVRAHAGSLVAYSFEPHGTRFSRVVSARQSLTGTEAEHSQGRVSGRGYFSSPEEIDWRSRRAAVSELSLVQRDQTSGSVTFYLNHFSGYLVAID